MARNYKRLGGIINASAGPAKARAVFAGSFGILRENVVNLRENPVSSQGVPTKLVRGRTAASVSGQGLRAAGRDRRPPCKRAGATRCAQKDYRGRAVTDIFMARRARVEDGRPLALRFGDPCSRELAARSSLAAKLLDGRQ